MLALKNILETLSLADVVITMKRIRNIFRNRLVILGILLYAVSFAILWPNKNFEHGEALSELILFGVGFPLLAWFATIRARPLHVAVHPNTWEIFVLILYLLGISIYLIFGSEIITPLLPAAWRHSEQIKMFVTLGKKLIVFVGIPFVLFRTLFGYRLKDFGVQTAGLRALAKDHLAVILVVSGAILLFQFFLGGGAAPIRHGQFSARQLVIGLPLCFAWLLLEVGLVEEFCFRALLQSRLAAWLQSEISGVALMSLLFGLAHAPGFIFRHAGAVESIGSNPTIRDSIAYSIAILSISGIFFGVIWARTKNLFVLMIIHAATDLLPNFSQFAKTWHL